MLLRFNGISNISLDSRLFRAFKSSNCHLVFLTWNNEKWSIKFLNDELLIKGPVR